MLWIFSLFLYQLISLNFIIDIFNRLISVQDNNNKNNNKNNKNAVHGIEKNREEGRIKIRKKGKNL